MPREVAGRAKETGCLAAEFQRGGEKTMIVEAGHYALVLALASPSSRGRRPVGGQTRDGAMPA